MILRVIPTVHKKAEFPETVFILHFIVLRVMYLVIYSRRILKQYLTKYTIANVFHDAFSQQQTAGASPRDLRLLFLCLAISCSRKFEETIYVHVS